MPDSDSHVDAVGQYKTSTAHDTGQEEGGDKENGREGKQLLVVPAVEEEDWLDWVVGPDMAGTH